MENKFRELNEKLKQVINELAFDRKKAIFEITNLCIPYTIHLIKLSIYGKDKQYENDWNKWKDEIYNFVNQASLYYNLKGNKNLKAKDYTDNFFFGLLETEQETKVNTDKILKDLYRKNFKKVSNINYNMLFKNHKVFVQEVLKQFPNIEYESIMELLNKYIVGCTN